MGNTQYRFAALTLAVICSRSYRISLSQSCRQRGTWDGVMGEWTLLWIYFSSGTAKSPLHYLPEFYIKFWSTYHFPHFIDEGTVAQRGQLNCQNPRVSLAPSEPASMTAEACSCTGRQFQERDTSCPATTYSPLSKTLYLALHSFWFMPWKGTVVLNAFHLYQSSLLQ